MGRSFYVLNHEESRSLQSRPSQDVVATGPWVKGPGELPHRVVLREVRSEFIVHLQVIDTDLGHAFYTHGNYYPCPLATVPAKPLASAWTTFEDRVRRGLDIGPRPRQQPEAIDDDQGHDPTATQAHV